MNNKFYKLFGNQKVVIGAVHLPPLLGFSNFPGFDLALKNALADVRALEEGGATAIIFENNYDIPHTEFAAPGAIASMFYIGQELKKATTLPLGISVLWNDYKTAFTIAKILNLDFIRIPVFVDTVETSYGVITGDVLAVGEYRSKVGANDILLFADIHVKHSKLLSEYSITESAQHAIKAGADALIITGRWTGESPDLLQVQEVRDSVKDFPILLGSGVDKSNIKELFMYANGAIVSTSLKEGSIKQDEVNVKGYDQRIDIKKVEELMGQI